MLRRKGILRAWASASSTYSGFSPSTEIMSREAPGAGFDAIASEDNDNDSAAKLTRKVARRLFTEDSLGNGNIVVGIDAAKAAHFQFRFVVARFPAQRFDIREPHAGIALARRGKRRDGRLALIHTHLHDARLLVGFLRLWPKEHREHHGHR